MKKFFVVVIGMLLFLIAYWQVEEYKKDNIHFIDEGYIALLDVKENRVTCEITSFWHISSWNYTYTLEDRNLYLTAYDLSFFNPKSVHSWLGVDINLGYNDFDNIYIDNRDGTEPILLWESKNVFSEDKVLELNVTNNEFFCKLDCEQWGYDYNLVSKKLYLNVYEKEERNENGLEIKIDKGYDDFDEVRIFGLGNVKVIWSKTE